MRSLRITGFFAIGLMTFGLAAGLLSAAGDAALVDAARRGDAAAVRALIARKADVNELARDGSSALLWAVYHSDVATARALMAAGANVNTANKYGVTPLIQAARTGDTPLIDALLKAGASVSAAHPDGETAVMSAARTGRTDAVKLLIEAGANVNAATHQDETAVMWAAAEGHADTVTALLAAGADANRKSRLNAITERKNSDHPTGGMTALMVAARNGHEAAVRALVAGGADSKAVNGDGVTAMAIAVINDRFDLAKVLLDLGADASDGSLYFAVDMHDATSDMRARDGSRLRADFENRLSSLDLIKALLDRGADPNKAFVGRLHSSTLCCDADVNASPFYRAAVAADVEALTLMIAKGAQLEWSPTEVKKEVKPGAPAAAGPGRGNPNIGRTPMMAALAGGRGAAFAAGPGFERLGPPPFREASNREPLDAVKVLIAAGANPNAKTPDGSTLLHQAVTARQVPIIRVLVTAGARLDAVNKDNLTPLLVAEKPEPPPPPGNNSDARTFRQKRNTREEVIAALRELMNLGPNDPAPVPPPLAPAEKNDAEKKPEAPSAE